MLRPHYSPDEVPPRRRFLIRVGFTILQRPTFLVMETTINHTTTCEAVVIRKNSYWELDHLETEPAWRRRRHATFLLGHLVLHLKDNDFPSGRSNCRSWAPLWIGDDAYGGAMEFFDSMDRRLSQMFSGESIPYLGEYT